MPKPTFFNLPADKRGRIVERAIDEFAERPYHEASLSRIVTSAGIAKGSLYQYFDNKFDLYRWLVTEEVPRRKLAFIERDAVRASPPSDLRGWLRDLVMSGMRFLVANPRVARVAEGLLAPTQDPELRALTREVRDEGHRRFCRFLEQDAIAQQIRTDVDPELVARVLAMVLGQGLRTLVDGYLGVDFDQLLDEPAKIPTARLETLVDDTVALLVEGIGAR